MTLKSDERAVIVAYRLEKAFKTIKEVKDVGALGYWTLAANRLYYAAYYASVALLKSGILSEQDSKLLGRLFTMRQSGDYEDLFDWEEKDVAPLVPEVEDYLKRVDSLIYQNLQKNP